ncbi:MAG TPA: hypothetical protein VF618_05390 [Thermoanaerobaculia bacterium]
MRILRVLALTALLTVTLFAIAAALLRQPTFTTIPFRGDARADAVRLRRHVDFFTIDVHPRNAEHPENLDRAAAYIADAFRGAGDHTKRDTAATLDYVKMAGVVDGVFNAVR